MNRQFLNRVGLGRRSMPPAAESHRSLGDWFGTGLGRALLRAERESLEPWQGRLFGQQVLQLGCADQLSLLEGTPASLKICFVPRWDEDSPAPVADSAALPLESESVDTVLIHHALDFAPDSHRVLREAARVVTPGGRVLMIGFNPVSLWGIGRLLRRGREPWNGRFISLRRAQDWLRLLGFQTEEVCFGGYLPPVNRTRFLERAAQFERLGHRFVPPLGAFYLIMARKQTIPLTPVRRRWKALRQPVLGSPAVDAGRVASRGRSNVVPLRWNRNEQDASGPCG